MPELAEVVFYQKRWSRGASKPLVAVHANTKARVFRSIPKEFDFGTLTGFRITEALTHGKQMLFILTKGVEKAWLGVHLGMTGELLHEPAGRPPVKHEHLVLETAEDLLIFRDYRMFGEIKLHLGQEPPAWWSDLPPEVTSEEFTKERVRDFLQRRKRSPIKAVLLMQECFPGIGNWMADEILWRAKVAPDTPAGEITRQRLTALHRETQWVAKESIAIIGNDFSDPPEDWLFKHRWKNGGHCPKTGQPLMREKIGGRTTCWSPAWQK